MSTRCVRTKDDGRRARVVELASKYPELTAQQIAQRVGMSPSHVKRICKDHGLQTKPAGNGLDPSWDC